ncbi:hypothetical protein KCU86_g7085, partial [Aureobasidium melanogenum]
MPESSQPRTSSGLCHETRFNSSDGPASDNTTEPIYHETVQTTSVPTKSGTEVTIRPHFQSDTRVPTSTPSSRPSSRGDELDHDTILIIQKNSATPSTEELHIPTRTILKPSTEPEPVESGFAFASRNNAPGKVQSVLSSQSSHTVPPYSFEKSNQEHQVSARSIQEESPIASNPQGLGRVFSWLSSWLTSNLEARVEYQKAVQSIGSPLSQNTSVAEGSKAPSIPHAQQNVPQRAEHSHMHGQRQLKRKRQFCLSQCLDGSTSRQNYGFERHEMLPSHTSLVKGMEVVSEAPPDTGDIFTVTVSESANHIRPISTEHAEQRDVNIEKEASVPPKASHTGSVDILMQDSTTLGDLLESKNDNTVSEQLAHDRSQDDDDRHVNLEEQLPVQTRPSDDDQRSSEEQHSDPEQNLTKDQRPVKDIYSIEEVQLAKSNQAVTPDQDVEVAQTALSTNAHRIGQQPPNLEGTMPSSLVDLRQSLREVSDRSGPPRVTKNRKKPSQPGAIVRDTMADHKSSSSSYTAAQLYQLADYLKEQERLQEKQDWVKDIAAKQAELEKSNRHRASLQAECVQLKARLQKYSKVSEHLVTMVKAYNGIGQDIKSLQKSRAKYDSDLREFKSQLHTNLDTATNVQEHITKLEEWKVNSLSLIRECKSSVAAVTKEKSDLERRLRETSESLVREKQRHDAFDKRLQTYQTEKNSTENMLNGCISKISDHLGEFKTFIEQGTSSSETSRELLELMKKENASISEQVCSSVTNMDALKTSVVQLSSGIEKHVGDLKSTNNSISKTRTEAENKVVAALDGIKSQCKIWEEISEKSSDARERMAGLQQNLNSSKEKISKLEGDLTNKNNAEAGLRKRIDELQSSQAALESDRATAEANKARLLELTNSENNLKQEVDKLKTGKADNMATIASMAEQKTTLQREKGDLQSQISEITKQLEDARHAVPDFGPEKARIEANHKKQHDDAVNEMNTQVRKLSIDFANEKLRLEKKKEEVDRELAAREDTIRDLKSQHDRLKQEYGNRSPAAWSEDMKQKDAYIQRLVNENSESGRRLEKLQQDLDQTRQSTENSLKKGVQDLRDRDRQIETLNGTNTVAQNTIKSLRKDLEEAKRSKETTIKIIQESANRTSQEAQIQLKAKDVGLTEANSAKRALETRLGDLEKRSSDEAELRQKEISNLRQSLEDANSRLREKDERHTQQQEVIRQRDSETEKLKQDIEKLKRDHAQATAVTEIPDSQPQEALQDQTSTPAPKKVRRAVNRNVRSVSKPSSSTTSTGMTQPTSDALQSTQPRSIGASIFGPFSEPRGNGHVVRPSDPPQEEEEMLDLENLRLQFAKTTSRPASSQSEAQRASSLGSQEVLDAEGVRFKSQNVQSQAQTQPQSPKHVSSSSSLSEVPDFDTIRNQPQYPWEETQSQDRTQVSQQQTQGAEPQTQQQSLDLSNFDDLAVASHAFETPMKTGGKNLQGVGKKLTPRPESQPKQSRPGALPSVAIPKLPKGSAVAPQLQKKVSALSSGPHNFKTGAKGKGKRVTYDVSEAEDSDVYSPPSSSVRGSHSPQKRSASQSSKVNKRQRTENATPAAATASQRSVTATPRRSQTTIATPGPQRRRSSRTNKEQNMMSRFNDEISSPRARR